MSEKTKPVSDYETRTLCTHMASCAQTFSSDLHQWATWLPNRDNIKELYSIKKISWLFLHQVCIWKHRRGIAEFCKIPQGNKFLPQVVLVYCHISQDLTQAKNDSWEKCRIEISINPIVLGSLKYLDRIFSWQHSCFRENDTT